MRVEVRVQLWLWIGLFIWLTFFALGLRSAFAHDVYTNLRSPQNGQLCCGGDPTTGDCEAVTYEQLKVNIDGSATFQSHRYNASVLVAAEKITWLPIDDQPAHWCGVPRNKVYLAPVNSENPDPTFWTYCAFIAPGGV